MVDGRGKIKEFVKPSYEDDPEYNDPYWAVIVSLGLMGIIVEVTFNLQPSYKVLGSQLVWPIGPVPESKKSKYPITWNMDSNQGRDPKTGDVVQDGDWTGPLDVFAKNDDAHSLYQLIMNPENRYKAEYLRVFAWPQVEPDLWTIWKAHRKQPDDERLVEWKANFDSRKGWKDIPYHEVAEGRSGVLEQKILGLLYNFFDHFTNINTMCLPKWYVSRTRI